MEKSRRLFLIISFLVFLPTCAIPVPLTKEYKTSYKPLTPADYRLMAEQDATLARRHSILIRTSVLNPSELANYEPSPVTHSVAGMRLKSKACLFAANGDFVMAAATMEQALKEAELGAAHEPALIYSCNNLLADFYLRLGDLQKAEAASLRSLAFLNKYHGLNMQYFYTYSQLADICRRMGRLEEAAGYEAKAGKLPEGHWWGRGQ
jgi:tetratricopeptide (TPR) repeat protein